MNILLNEVFNGILEGDSSLVQIKVAEAVNLGLSVETILNDGMVAAMSEVGRRFQCNDFYIPEVLVSAQAMQIGMTIIKPLLTGSNIKARGKVVIGTVNGDLHDIGKNLVSLMLEGAGFQIKDLGVDVSPDQFVKAINEFEPDILALSALLTTTMINMGNVIDAIDKANLRKKVKIIIGGAPLSSEFAEKIGADGYAPDASRAVDLVRSIVN